MKKLSKAWYRLISLGLFLLLAGPTYADSTSTSIRSIPSAVTSAIATESVAITFTSSSNLGATQVTTCPSPSTSPTLSSGVLSFALTSQPTETVQTATSGSSYEDQHFTTQTTSAVPAYITCNYLIEYYKNSTLTNANLATAQLLFGTTTVPSTQHPCPTNVFGTNATNFQCIIGWGSILYNNAGAGTIAPNTSICLDDSALQASFNGGLTNNNTGTGGNGSSFTVSLSPYSDNGASGIYKIQLTGVFSYLFDNAAGNTGTTGNSLTPIPSCSSPLQIYLPPGTTYSYNALYEATLTSNISGTKGNWAPAVIVATSTPTNVITITAGKRNTWKIGSAPNVFSQLCWTNNSYCSSSPSTKICMTGDCGAGNKNTTATASPTTSVTVSAYP